MRCRASVKSGCKDITLADKALAVPPTRLRSSSSSNPAGEEQSFARVCAFCDFRKLGAPVPSPMRTKSAILGPLGPLTLLDNDEAG